MQIIKQGRKQNGWSHEYTCTGGGNGGGGCSAELLVSEHDMYKFVHQHYPDGSTTYVYFCCPNCGVKTDVGDDDGGNGYLVEIPDRIRRNAKRK